MSKPRVLLLIDVYGWAFHTLARGLQASLATKFSVDIAATADRPELHLADYDILHVFGIRNEYHRAFAQPSCKVVKSLYNTVRKPAGETAAAFQEKYLQGVDALTVPTKAMHEEVKGITLPIFLTPEGVDTKLFHPTHSRTGPLTVGWAGNTAKVYKQFAMAYQACTHLCELKVADGTLNEQQMITFFNNVDVILCTSKPGEGCPRSLLEGMACGCFPVSFPVGIAPESVTTYSNGILVEQNSQPALRKAIEWCCDNTEKVRSTRACNSKLMQQHRDWTAVAPITGQMYYSLLEHS